VDALKVCSDSTAADWDAFVNSEPQASAYHLWGWRQVFERAFGHQTVYLIARRGEAIVGALPLVLFNTWVFGRFGVSLPFVNYGGVLAREEAVARALLEAAGEVAATGRLAHLELRHRHQRFPELPFKHHKVGMTLRLAPDDKTAWDRLDRKVRNQVRKAEKSDLATRAGGLELLPAFYRVFSHNMRDLGTPVYAKRFFETIFEQFPDQARVYLVQQGTKPVAAAISYAWRDTIEVPWASSLRRFRTFNPNMLLYWFVIRQAIAAGFRIFDFGRSTPDEGTYHFKRQWGAEPEPLAWEYRLLQGSELPDQSPKNPRFRLAIAAWQRLPLWVTRIAGPPIVRNIP
jgi:FemAB-related protein (PEP-CTERM system-associated)